MRLFRSEEHVHRWCAQHKREPGAIFTVSQAWTMATLWFADRMSPDWRRRTVDEAHAIFAAAGQTGAFWQLG